MKKCRSKFDKWKGWYLYIRVYIPLSNRFSRNSVIVQNTTMHAWAPQSFSLLIWMHACSYIFRRSENKLSECIVTMYHLCVNKNTVRIYCRSRFFLRRFCLSVKLLPLIYLTNKSISISNDMCGSGNIRFYRRIVRITFKERLGVS